MRDDVRARRGSQQVNNETLEPEYEIVDWIGLYCIGLYPSDEESVGNQERRRPLDVDWKGRQASIEHHQEEARVREGGAVLCSFIDWFLLLLVARCLLGLSLVSRVSCLVCESFISSSLWFEQLGFGTYLCRCVREIEVKEMGDDTLDRDARIKLSIGTKEYGNADGQLYNPAGLVFDHHRGLLFVSDYSKHRVQVFSCDDGSFVSKFGETGNQPGQFAYPKGLAIDHDHDSILVVDQFNDRVQSWSLSEQSFLSCVGHRESRALERSGLRGIAIDKRHRRIIIADSNNHRLVFLSSIDLSFLFSVGGKQGSQAGQFHSASGIAIDDDRHRIIVLDTRNHRVQVLSLIDGSFLFLFGSRGNQPGKLEYPQGVCIDNQGRIIVADTNNRRLQSFTHEGHHISSFDCGREYPQDAAFDEHRGLIAFAAGNRVHVIGANQWLADTFTWRPDRHRYAPSWMKQAVLTMTMIRSLVVESSMSMIPNELLFEIFSFL